MYHVPVVLLPSMSCYHVHIILAFSVAAYVHQSDLKSVSNGFKFELESVRVPLFDVKSFGKPHCDVWDKRERVWRGLDGRGRGRGAGKRSADGHGEKRAIP